MWVEDIIVCNIGVVFLRHSVHVGFVMSKTVYFNTLTNNIFTVTGDRCAAGAQGKVSKVK